MVPRRSTPASETGVSASVREIRSSGATFWTRGAGLVSPPISERVRYIRPPLGDTLSLVGPMLGIVSVVGLWLMFWGSYEVARKRDTKNSALKSLDRQQRRAVRRAVHVRGSLPLSTNKPFGACGVWTP